MDDMKHLLIDGDILMFKFAFRHQTNIQWDNGAETELLDKVQATADLDEFIDRIMEKTGCLRLSICFTSKLNFRYALLPTYKHNRVNSTPPTMLRVLKDYMRKEYSWLTWDHCEADDVMGILGSRDPNKYVLATIDKDFESLPCTLFNWNKNRKPRRISKRKADYNFHKQWLMGDTTDGFHGCYNIGGKKAEAILDGSRPEEWSLCAVSTYAASRKPLHKRGEKPRWSHYSWDDIVTQARMARILRHTDWDWKRREPILWTPNV